MKYYFRGTTEISESEYRLQKRKEQQAKRNDKRDLMFRLLVGTLAGGFGWMVSGGNTIAGLIIFVLVASIVNSKPPKFNENEK